MSEASPEFVWGAQAIGEVIGVDLRSAIHLLQTRKIPARKVGKKWVSRRAELVAVLTGTAPKD